MLAPAIRWAMQMGAIDTKTKTTIAFVTHDPHLAASATGQISVNDGRGSTGFDRIVLTSELRTDG
jgi:ABC-type lipoprotein export system ATPase subunit